MAEMNTRPAAEILSIILGRSAEPVTVARPAARRMIGVCRHFVTLYCALLRHQGVPARARCGFADYFAEGEWTDHWIAEYWESDSRRWVTVDPQLGAQQTAKWEITFDPADLPEGVFLSGAQAWLRHRAGEAGADRIGIGDLRGAWFIAGNVVRDLAALNKIEVLPWDVWGPLDNWAGSAVDMDLVDRIASAVAGGSLTAIRQAFDDNPAIKVPEDTGQLRPVRER